MKNKTLRLGVLLSGGGRTMVNLASCIKRGELAVEIVCAVSSRSAVAGVARARELGIEPQIVRKKDFDGVTGFSEDGSLASNAPLNDPEYMFTREDGSVVISEGDNGRILVIKRDGTLHTLAGRK